MGLEQWHCSKDQTFVLAACTLAATLRGPLYTSVPDLENGGDVPTLLGVLGLLFPHWPQQHMGVNQTSI